MLVPCEHLPLELKSLHGPDSPVFCIWSVLSPFSRESCIISPLTGLEKTLLVFRGIVIKWTFCCIFSFLFLLMMCLLRGI